MNELTILTTDQIKLLEQNKIIPKGCPTEQVQFFSEVCRRKKLDPFLKQIHLVERRSKDGDKWITSYTIQAAIDGMRALAQRNGKISGIERGVKTIDGKLYGWCRVRMKDGGEYYDELPFDEYCQKKSDGKPNSFWSKLPETMIKKCAEESVLRMASPEDLSGVYGDDEMEQADSESKETKLLAEPKEPKVIIDYEKEFASMTKRAQVDSYIKCLDKEEQSTAKPYAEKRKREIIKDNLEPFINQLKLTKGGDCEANRQTIEKIFDEMPHTEERDRLIKVYNAKLIEIGLDETDGYVDLPFAQVS